MYARALIAFPQRLLACGAGATDLLEVIDTWMASAQDKLPAMITVAEHAAELAALVQEIAHALEDVPARVAPSAFAAWSEQEVRQLVHDHIALALDRFGARRSRRPVALAP